MGDSNFLCSYYDNRDDLEANDTDLWGRDHNFEAEEIIAMGNTEGGNWNSDIQGIQGRLIAEYSEQRRPNGGNLP